MIAVIGDLFVDKYFLGTTRGMSAEAAIPIVDISETKSIAGGAGNVLMNLLSLGEPDAKYFSRPQQNYPAKNRLMTGDTQLARWDEQDYCYPYSIEDLEGLDAADVVIVSDYCKGSISKEVIQHLRRLAERGKTILVDTKGDPLPWVGSEAVLFPNRTEYARYKDHYAWIHNVILKQSSDGIAFVEFGNVVLTRPATADFVRSVNGAGDTVIAAFAVALRMGMNIPEILEFCNAAAACAVEQSLTSVVTMEEIENKLGKVVSRENYPSSGLPRVDAAYPHRAGVVSRFGLVDIYVFESDEGC